MAVVDRYGAYIRGPVNQTPPYFASPGKLGSAPKILMERVDFTSGDSVGSKGYFGRLPRHAVILPTSQVFFGAHGTGVTLDIGDANSVDALATDIAIAAAGSSVFLEAVAAEDLGKPLWEQLGYATIDDAPALIDLFCTIAGAATGASKSVAFCLFYTE